MVTPQRSGYHGCARAFDVAAVQVTVAYLCGFAFELRWAHGDRVQDGDVEQDDRARPAVQLANSAARDPILLAQDLVIGRFRRNGEAVSGFTHVGEVDEGRDQSHAQRMFLPHEPHASVAVPAVPGRSVPRRQCVDGLPCVRPHVPEADLRETDFAAHQSLQGLDDFRMADEPVELGRRQ